MWRQNKRLNFNFKILKISKSGSNFRGSDFRGSNFRGDNVNGSIFRSSNFRGSNFRRENVNGSKFRREKSNRSRVTTTPWALDILFWNIFSS